MIITLLLNLVVLVLGAIFTLFPVITKLPSIFGFDIDTALVTGMGSVYALFQTFWVLNIIFQGLLALLGYYILKMIIRFFLGHRAP